MRILIAVKPGILQQSIVNISKEVPAIQMTIYGGENIPVDELTESFSLIIMDTGWGNNKKKELFKVLIAAEQALQVLVIGPAQDYDQLFNWLCTGAVAAMLDSEIKVCLKPILMQVQKSAPILSAIISRQLLLILGSRNSDLPISVDYDLTSREKDVLSAIVKGLTYKMAGRELNISPETVRGHVKNIYKKLMVCSQSQAVAKALYHHLV